jgi:hypothetical protein
MMKSLPSIRNAELIRQIISDAREEGQVAQAAGAFSARRPESAGHLKSRRAALMATFLRVGFTCLSAPALAKRRTVATARQD